MRKKQTTKTVEFGNLSEGHKAQFIQFLIKNNICFQEGKENCTARVSLKSTKTPINHPDPHVENKTHKSVKPRQTINRSQIIKKSAKVESKPLQTHNDILNRENVPQTANRQLKTPTKEPVKQLKGSAINAKGRSLTGKKAFNQTPRKNPSGASGRKSINPQSLNKIQDNSSNKLKEEPIMIKNSAQKLDWSHQKQKQNNTQKVKVKIDMSRDRVVNKYANLFDLCEKGRAVRWPTNMLERSIEEIYDDIFTRNTQCLQNKNINNALKTLTQLTFPQLIEGYFRKKFKGSKLAATNLNNMMYTLSSTISKEQSPAFVKTFQEFLVGDWQHEDLLYYLFARNVIKRQLRVNDKNRDLNRTQGCYFTQVLKLKDISKCLFGIIGKDPQLIGEYKQLLIQQIGSQQIQVYEFLKVLLEDYHAKRIGNKLSLGSESMGQTLYDKDNSYDCRNTQQLTFGQEQQQQKESLLERCSQFWNCQQYSRIKDNLFDLIMQKMAQKVVQLVELLANDIEVPSYLMQTLQQILLRKAESLVKAVFQMNKMKWFKELAITYPNEEDMNAIEGVQIRLRQLRSNPSGREIGEFCKNVLTTKALINQLQLALMIND